MRIGIKSKYLILQTAFIMLLLLSPSLVQAQDEAPMQQENIDTDEKTKTDLGLKIGFGFSTLSGTGLENPRPYFGYAIAMYQRFHLNKKKSFAFQYEIAARFKGANFANGDSGYSKLSLFYIEMPLLASIKLNKSERLPSYILFGIQPGLLVKSTLAISESRKTPSYFDLPLANFDIAPVIAFQFALANRVGVQFGFKYGLRNVATNNFNSGNPKFNLKDQPRIVPFINPGVNVRNISFEMGFVF
ncbi:MAG: PorT family protein [Bacteroidia bacterium]|nr:PorT family protein [Bacteroidia bacterium]